MQNSNNYSGLKLEVLSKLRKRNKIERKKYEDIVNLTTTLYELLDVHQKENLRLRVSKANLEQDVIELHTVPDGSRPRPFKRSASGRSFILLQGELAELQKQNREYAQEVKSLRKALDEKEQEIEAKNLELQELKATLNSTKRSLNQVQLKLEESDYNLQFVKEEYDALLITHSSVEESKQELEKRNQLIQIKAIDSEKLNVEAELFQRNENSSYWFWKDFWIRKKQAKLQKGLKGAAEEPRIINTNYRRCQICLDAILPTRVMCEFEAHDGEVYAVAWTHTDFIFATAGGDRKVKLWEISTGKSYLKNVATESKSSVFSVDFDSEENLLLAASYDCGRIWSVPDFKIKHTLAGHNQRVMSIKFLGDNSKVVSGSYDRTLKIWNLNQRICIKTVWTGSRVSDVVTIGSSDNIIVSGHFDRKIRCWDLRSESCNDEIVLPGRITSLDLSVDGYSLLACTKDDSLNLIDFRMNNIIKTLSADSFIIGCDWTRAKFSPDGQFCACGSHDGSIYIWKITTGQLVKVLREHNSTVVSCAWSWCGTYLLSCDKSRKAILWSEF